MLNVLHHLERTTRSAGAAMAVAVLACLALFGASGDAKAGYTCVDNTTQIGNSVTIEIVASSGGANARCITSKDADTGPSNISISGSVTSTQVGATTAGVFSRSFASVQGLGSSFPVSCTNAPSGGVCTNSNSGTINGVDFVQCRVDSTSFPNPIPDPALPLVPVVITTVCTISY